MSNNAILRPAAAGTRENAKDEYKDFGKDKLKGLTDIFNQKATITKNYEVKRTFKPDWKAEATVAADSANAPAERDPNIIRTVAGEAEKPDYKLSTPLKNARAMFEQAAPQEYKARNKLSKPSPRPKVQRANTAPEQPENPPAEQAPTGVVRSSDVVDDRPTQLTTSLQDARKRFEKGDSASLGNTPSRQMPLWEGKTGASKLGGGAKKLFEQGDNAAAEPPKAASKPIELPKAEVVAASSSDEEVEPVVEEEPVVRVVEVEEPEKISCFTEQAREASPEVPVSSPSHEEPVAKPRSRPDSRAGASANALVADVQIVVQPSDPESEDEQPAAATPETSPELVATAPSPLQEPENALQEEDPEHTQLNESPTKEASFTIAEPQQQHQPSHKSSKDEDYDSADVLSDAGSTTSQEVEAREGETA